MEGKHMAHFTGANMTRRDLGTYRRRLLEMAGRLTGDVSHLRGEALRPTGGEASTSSTDAEVVNREAEEEVALAVLTVEEHSLGEITAALARIDAGTFGRCAACGRAILKARLDVLPYASHCTRCARRHEGRASGPRPA
jgi:DnaK suppressor protein